MPKMKDSGVEWLGEIPESWTICKCKYLFSYRKQIVGNGVSNFERLALTLNGVIKRSKEDDNGLQPTDFSTYQILRTNQLVFKLIDLQNVSTSRVGLSSFDGIVSPAYIILEPSKSISPKFAEQYFLMLWHRQIFNQLGDAGVRSSLNAGDLLDVPFVLPPIDTQNNIVNFLDSKKIWIKSLTDNLNNQIDKLKEYKKALITKCVTKGLDPNVPLKDSGIDWMGPIPRNWKILKGKFVLTLLNRPVLETDGVITCFRDGEVTLRSNRREEGFTFSTQEIGYQGIEEGDLVVHGMDGFAGAIGISDSRGKGSPILNVMDTPYNKRFIMYYLRGLAYLDVFTGLSTGIRVRSCDLRWNKLSNLFFVIPPLSEQSKIADFLDKKSLEIDNVVSSKQQQIDKLNEYQKSLIYEYVTGKKEII